MIGSFVVVSSSEAKISSVVVNSSVERFCFVVSIVDIIVGNVVVVENKGEYNGIEAVDWTPVYSVEFSVVDCTKGNGVLPDVSECWINDILDKSII